MGRPYERSGSPASRFRKYLAFRPRHSLLPRIAFVIILLAFFQQQRLYFIYREALAAKYLPTEFEESTAPGLASARDLQLQNELLAHREQWEELGVGYEGKTFKYQDSVIKTFRSGNSPFRNCAPGEPQEPWPAEIPSSLAFGGVWSGLKSSRNPFLSTNESIARFLPVKAHFVASSSSTPEWHLVTPLVNGGNIVKLAKSLHNKAPYKYYREVDAAYRPSFHRVLRALEMLHEKGYCHDDIKPSNIFVENDTNWILGDLGNVRQVSHAYHSSRLWLRDNHQLADCRANDVLRALKSYLHFIRAASDDRDDFDTAFFEGRETLSRLFWWTVADSTTMSAAELRVRSQVESPGQAPEAQASLDVRQPPHSHILGFALSKKRMLARAVTKALETKFREQAARWAALTAVFGVPVQRCGP